MKQTYKLAHAKDKKNQKIVVHTARNNPAVRMSRVGDSVSTNTVT